MASQEISIQDKYIASMVLSGVGDALGYKNGEWEFCHSGKLIQNEVKKLGGVAKINVSLPNFCVSDDTVMHLATAEALIEKPFLALDPERLYLEFAAKYKKCMEDMIGRAPGNTCINSVAQLRPNVPKGYQLNFNPNGGGCGAAMRMMCIGLRYPRPDQLDKLIAVSIEAGRMTHHHPVGYLGGLVAALFTSYAIQGRPPREWASGLLLSLKQAKDYVAKEGRFVTENLNAWDQFSSAWKEYSKLRQIIDGKSNPVFPYPYGTDERDEAYEIISDDSWAGQSGRGASIIAYDALLAAGSSWIELCNHAVFHAGDSDSTGCIAGAWYGALYGFDGVPEVNYKNLEYLARLKSAGEKLYALSHVD